MNKLGFIIILFSLNSVPSTYSHAESFTNYSALGGDTKRSPNVKARKSCTNYFCGPISTINITTDSTHEEDLHNYNAGDNSTFEQMIKRGQDFDKYGPAAVMKDMAKAQQRAQNNTKVKIKIPLIDYDFSGTFNNVLIKVTSKGEVYKSTNQDLSSGGVTELTGTVNIETYTPFVLKGSYSATLNQYDSIPIREIKCPAFSDPSTPPCIQFRLEASGTIDGEFNIVSPWRDDERINNNIDMQSSFVEPFKNDIKGMAEKYNIDIDVDKEFEQVNANKPQDNSSSKAGSVYGDCNCSCNFTQSASTQCKSTCSRVFEACNGVRHLSVKSVITNRAQEVSPPTLPLESAPKPQGAKLHGIDQSVVDELEKGTVAAPGNLRSKFITLLETKHPGQQNAPIRDMMLKGFDQMPDEKSKMLMLMSIEGM